MSSTIHLLVVLLLCSPGLVAASGAGSPNGCSDSSYLFPTGVPRVINSGFADYRETHFHGGIDISTDGKIGYPVYAAKSGYVYRVTVSPYGYGKRIVLRHDDSTYTLYAHLSDFSEEIDKRVEAAQRASGRYDVDLQFHPDEITVRRGEMIARTGATGAGGPHLHFEVHDRDYGFVDPLIYKSLDVTDHITPRVFGVGVRELYSGNARVSGVVRLRHGYRTRNVFYMHEPFFFVIHAADSYGRRRYKRPPKHIRLVIDGKKYLSVDLTHIGVRNYLDVSSLVDLKLSRGHVYKTYYKLCVDRATPFPVFSPSAPLSGLIYDNLSNGTHTYEIAIADESGDSTSVRGKFVLEIRNDRRVSGAAEAIEPFREKVVRPLPGLTLLIPAGAFVKNVNVKVSRVSSRAFRIQAIGESLTKRILVKWKVNNPKLGLFRKSNGGWQPAYYRNDGKILTAKIGYELGKFALIRDNKPPVVEMIRVSETNPLYRSVAPTDFSRDFVYFRVFDNLSNLNTNDILLKVGTHRFICEYDADKHTALCRVDKELLHREGSVAVVVRDNAGNQRTVASGLRFK